MAAKVIATLNLCQEEFDVLFIALGKQKDRVRFELSTIENLVVKMRESRLPEAGPSNA